MRCTRSGIDTRNADFNRLIERIELVALRSRDPILLAGPSGAGKSTLFGLLLRFYDPTHGVVSIDGVDVSTVDVEALRNEVLANLEELQKTKAHFLELTESGEIELVE